MMMMALCRVNSKGAVLSNYEVLRLLQEVCHQGNKGKRNLTRTQSQIASIAFDVRIHWFYFHLCSGCLKLGKLLF